MTWQKGRAEVSSLVTQRMRFTRTSLSPAAWLMPPDNSCRS